MNAVVSNASPLTGLEPGPVWHHFAALTRIPRPSKHEQGVRRYVTDWARQRGIDASADQAGNLILRIPASAGAEHLPTTILQAHMDMVCQKNSDSAHDFHRDPIAVERSGPWLRAPTTTLGADDGIGVALILAACEDKDLRHGPLIGLLTADEEDGMGGAQGVDPSKLRATYMINLDTEEWGEFYLGCAGGVDVNVHRIGNPAPWPAGHVALEVQVSGLRGGHSGIDIHEGRGNAIKILVRALLGAATQGVDYSLATLTGGTARNALPREASATLAVPAACVNALRGLLAATEQTLRREFAGMDDDLQLRVSPGSPLDQVLGATEQTIWLQSLYAAPYGVQRMSVSVPGVVETSNNLGIVNLAPASGTANLMVRSLLDSSAMALAEQIRCLFHLSGSRVDIEGQYPGWSPNPASALLTHCQAVYADLFGANSTVKVIHAGLECGIIGAKSPGLDIISFGPTIRGAHAPGECVHIPSVGDCWTLLREVLARLPA